MTIIKILFLNMFFFISYSVIFIPILLPVINYEFILSYFSIDITSEIQSTMKYISFIIIISIFTLSYQATKLHDYFGFSVSQALWSPFNYVKSIFITTNNEASPGKRKEPSIGSINSSSDDLT